MWSFGNLFLGTFLDCWHCGKGDGTNFYIFWSCFGQYWLEVEEIVSTITVLHRFYYTIMIFALENAKATSQSLVKHRKGGHLVGSLVLWAFKTID